MTTHEMAHRSIDKLFTNFMLKYFTWNGQFINLGTFEFLFSQICSKLDVKIQVS